MARRTEQKIVLVVRRTRLDELVVRFNTEDQARFHVERLGASFDDYREEDRVYRAAVRAVEEVLAEEGRVQRVDRSFLPNFLFGPEDTVVALGQDGLVANVLKYLDEQPLVGVNPDPARMEGVLLPFRVGDLESVMPEVLARRRPVRLVTMAEAVLNTGQVVRAVNDLFVGPRTHASARYLIRQGGREERQSSSGIIVSTGLGSTGWLRSVLAGAAGIFAASSGRALGAGMAPMEPMGWDAEHLVFSVREPWPSRTSGATIAFGRVTAEEPLEVVSQMPENGVIFSDGMEADLVVFHAGTTARIGLSERRGRLVS